MVTSSEFWQVLTTKGEGLAQHHFDRWFLQVTKKPQIFNIFTTNFFNRLWLEILQAAANQDFYTGLFYIQGITTFFYIQLFFTTQFTGGGDFKFVIRRQFRIFTNRFSLAMQKVQKSVY